MRRIPMSSFAVAAAAMLLLLAPSPGAGRAAAAAAATAPPLHLQDRAFLLSTMELDLAQVELGRLAADKGQDEEVRAFGRRMADYHRQSSERLEKNQLSQAAEALGIN